MQKTAIFYFLFSKVYKLTRFVYFLMWFVYFEKSVFPTLIPLVRNKFKFSVMKYYVWVIVAVLSITAYQKVTAQIVLKTEYIAPSNFLDENGNQVGEGKGDLKSISGGLQIPVSVKMNELNQPTAWAVALKGTYVSMNNKNLSTDYCLNEVLNAQLAVIHTRPLSERWSLIAMLGGGVYTDLSEFSGKCILGQGGALFIRKMNPNLDLGGGAAINNVLGYPMAFFALYLDWHKNGKFDFNISMTTTFEISASMQVKENLRLRLIGEANGVSAVVNKDGKSKIFVQQYSTIGLQPEFKLAKYLTARITGGVSVSREAYFQDRTIKAFYGDTPDEYPHFNIAPYFAVAIKYGL